MKTLDDLTVKTIPWHDADIFNLAIEWSESGDSTINLAIKINPEEDLDSLIAIGINTDTFKIKFEHVWQFNSQIFGDTAQRAVLDDLRIIEESTLIEKIRASNKTLLRHYQLILSNGSVIDIVCERLFIEEILN